MGRLFPSPSLPHWNMSYFEGSKIPFTQYWCQYLQVTTTTLMAKHTYTILTIEKAYIHIQVNEKTKWNILFLSCITWATLRFKVYRWRPNYTVYTMAEPLKNAPLVFRENCNRDLYFSLIYISNHQKKLIKQYYLCL